MPVLVLFVAGVTLLMVWPHPPPRRSPAVAVLGRDPPAPAVRRGGRSGTVPSPEEVRIAVAPRGSVTSPWTSSASVISPELLLLLLLLHRGGGSVHLPRLPAHARAPLGFPNGYSVLAAGPIRGSSAKTPAMRSVRPTPPPTAVDDDPPTGSAVHVPSRTLLFPVMDGLQVRMMRSKGRP